MLHTHSERLVVWCAECTEAWCQFRHIQKFPVAFNGFSFFRVKNYLRAVCKCKMLKLILLGQLNILYEKLVALHVHEARGILEWLVILTCLLVNWNIFYSFHVQRAVHQLFLSLLSICKNTSSGFKWFVQCIIVLLTVTFYNI